MVCSRGVESILCREYRRSPSNMASYVPAVLGIEVAAGLSPDGQGRVEVK
jgi:hypothetical protein